MILNDTVRRHVSRAGCACRNRIYCCSDEKSMANVEPELSK